MGFFTFFAKSSWEVTMGSTSSKTDEPIFLKLGWFLADLWQDSGKAPVKGFFQQF